MIISGVLAVLLWKKGEEHKDLEEAPKELRQLVGIGFFLLSCQPRATVTSCFVYNC